MQPDADRPRVRENLFGAGHLPVGARDHHQGADALVIQDSGGFRQACGGRNADDIAALVLENMPDLHDGAPPNAG